LCKWYKEPPQKNIDVSLENLTTVHKFLKRKGDVAQCKKKFKMTKPFKKARKTKRYKNSEQMGKKKSIFL